MIDEDGTVAIDSPETRAAIEYAKALYETFIPGTESWLDINNNRAFLAGQISLTANGVSLYYAATKDPAMDEIAEDIRTTNLPIGPVGKSVELHQTTSLVDLQPHPVSRSGDGLPAVHVRQPDRMNAWIEGASAYCCGALKGFADNPVWTSNPIHAPYAKASESLRPERLRRPARLRLGRRDGRLRARRHVRRGGHRPRTADDAIANAARRTNRYYS